MTQFDTALAKIAIPGEYDAMDACDRERWDSVLRQVWEAAIDAGAAVCDDKAASFRGTVGERIAALCATDIREMR